VAQLGWHGTTDLTQQSQQISEPTNIRADKLDLLLVEVAWLGMTRIAAEYINRKILY